MHPAPPATARPVIDPTLPLLWRMLALIFLLLMAVGLYRGGALPIAVGLFTPPWDKLAHALTFALIGAASALASGERGMALLASAVLGAVLVGAMDEWHQRFLPGRSAGWDDLLADAAGGLLGAAVAQLFYRLRQRAMQA